MVCFCPFKTTAPSIYPDLTVSLIISLTPYIFLVLRHYLPHYCIKRFGFSFLFFQKNTFQELFLNCSNLKVCSCLSSTKLQYLFLAFVSVKNVLFVVLIVLIKWQGLKLDNLFFQDKMLFSLVIVYPEHQPKQSRVVRTVSLCVR